MTNRRITHAILLSILLTGFGIRLIGVRYGLPYLYHPDEGNKVQAAVRVFTTGDLHPHYFKKPALLIYVNALSYVPYYLTGRAIGIFETKSDLKAPSFNTMGVGVTDSPGLMLLGRLVTVVVGTLCILLVFLIGRAMSGEARVGLIASFMLAVSPTHVKHSRFLTENMFVVLFGLVTLYASVRILRAGRSRDYLIAGLGVGLAAASKYPGALFAIIPASAHLFRTCSWRSAFDLRFIMSGVMSVLTFFVTNPYALLDYRGFLGGIAHEGQHYSGGHLGMEGSTLSFYVDCLWSREGAFITLFSMLSIVRGLQQREKITLLVSLFPLFYFAFINGFEVRNDRTLLPMLSFLYLLSAQSIVSLARELANRQASRAIALVAFLAVTIGLLLPFRHTLVETLEASSIDGRESARRWIEANLPPGSRIAFEPYSPYLDPTRFQLKGMKRGLFKQDTDWYIANEFDYVIAAEGMFRRFYEDPKYRDYAARYEALFQRFELVKVFNEGNYEVRLYRVPKK